MSTGVLVALAGWAAVIGWRRRPVARRAGPVAPAGRHRSTWRPHRRLPSALPEAVDAVAAAVRAGRSVRDGVAAAAGQAPAGLAAELRGIVDTCGRGLPVAVAVERWARATAEPGAGLVAAAVGLAGDAGADVAAALGGVAGTLRERRALGREIRALSAQARLSSVVVAVAPAAFAAVAALADPGTARFLLATPPGWVCIGTGLTLDLAGWRWMHRLAATVR